MLSYLDSLKFSQEAGNLDLISNAGFSPDLAHPQIMWYGFSRSHSPKGQRYTRLGHCAFTKRNRLPWIVSRGLNLHILSVGRLDIDSCFS